MFFQSTSGKWSSEIPSQKMLQFGKSEAKYWTESLNRFLKNSEKVSLFEPLFGNKTFEDFVRLLPLIWCEISKRAFFDGKERKLMQKQWFFESFLWDFAHKPKIHLFRSFSIFDLIHYRLWVLKTMCFCVFSHVFRAFWETWLDSRISLEGGL